jgi:hypothetical protein
MKKTAHFLSITCLGAFLSITAYAQTAVFNLQDNTNLQAGTYQIYVTGFSTAGPFVLQADGSWAAPEPPTASEPTKSLPCYRFPQDISQVQINSQQTTISARVYYFVVTDPAKFQSCNPTIDDKGLFNVVNAFTYTGVSPLILAVPAVTEVTNRNFPAWTFSEIGTSETHATIDLSQVDFFAFPMHTTAPVITTEPANPSVIGNPIGASANPATVVNHPGIRDSYSAFVNGLAQSRNDNKACSEDDTPAVCAYLDLLQDITTPTSTVSQYVIQNPGGFLGQNSAATQASRLNTVFDELIGKLWTANSPPVLALDSGGPLGTVARDVFTSTVVTMNFPGSTYPVTALKFTGTAASDGYIAYVFSPQDFMAGCDSGDIPIQYCTNPTSTGFQVFAGAGTLGAPLADTFTQLFNAGALSPGTVASDGGSYAAVVTRLGFLISGAMNRGVALVSCPLPLATWQCWQDETYWYPTSTSTADTPPSIYPDITQNLFSQWMHTATIGGTPMFVRPPNAVRSAGGTPALGQPMGMAYGFSNDEDPTPKVADIPQPTVPSKMDQTVVYGGDDAYTITFGPWVTPATMPTLVVNNAGGGTVTSTPAGIHCDYICSHAYPAGTKVTLTANPGPGQLFSGWMGACTGSSTTCIVTMNSTTTLSADFEAKSDAPSNTHGLHVMVNGVGTVSSGPDGLNCGSTCSTFFDENTLVTLVATAAQGWVFAGWSGACEGAGLTCSVTLTQAHHVGAAFVDDEHYKLSVTGAVGGIISTSHGAIDCGTRCIAGYAAGTKVHVIARPRPGYRFDGWGGACSGTQTCDLTMNSNASVQATFTEVPTGQFALSVHDYGKGTVLSWPDGINCGVDCTANFSSGSEVMLTATPRSGNRFTGWTGACSGTEACFVWMDNHAYVNAHFAPVHELTDEAVPALTKWAMLLMGLLVLITVYRYMQFTRYQG